MNNYLDALDHCDFGNEGERKKKKNTHTYGKTDEVK